eukprot:2759252-Pleurochrysis_carterae.AAC.5
MAASMINPSGFFWLLVIAVLSFGLYVGMPLRWFSLHPICMLLAFGALAAGGIRFKREGGRQNTISHAWLMASSTAIALAGWYVIYEQKRMLEKPHNTSWHAWTGLVVIFGFATGTVGSWIALHPDTGLRKGNKRRLLQNCGPACHLATDGIHGLPRLHAANQYMSETRTSSRGPSSDATFLPGVQYQNLEGLLTGCTLTRDHATSAEVDRRVYIQKRDAPLAAIPESVTEGSHDRMVYILLTKSQLHRYANKKYTSHDKLLGSSENASISTVEKEAFSE